jgi:hypothetical protein
LHYEKPPCGSDEVVGNINGANGTLCAPKCDAQGKCPTDVPAGTWRKNTTKPQCILSDATTGEHYCALTCVLVGCPTGAHCAMIGIVAGVCLYPNGTQANAAPVKNLVVNPEAAAPTQPHLAQAWTALSKGDGLPNTVGLEHYIYEDQRTPGGLQGHIWDYGDSCKKIEVNTHGHYDQKTTSFDSGTYYINCDAVDCCYTGRGTSKTIPDVKQWDIATQGPGGFSKVHFVGLEDTTELNDNPVKQAEHWMETDKMPFQPPHVNVSYHYYITRSDDGITSHRIDYSAPGAAPGSIVYGNFTIIKNLTAHRNLFQIPDKCYPQGSGGRGHALACDGKMLKTWEQKYFKHSHATAASVVV